MYNVSTLWLGKKSKLNYSQVGLQVLLFCTTRACKFVILRTEQRPAWTQALPPFVIKHRIQCTVYAIYLYCSFNYPVLSAFEVRSISSYLMPGEACTYATGAWILLFHLPPFSPVVLIVPFSFVTQSSMDGKSGGLASCAQEPHLLKKIFSDLHSQLVLNSSLMLCLHSIYSIKILAQAGFMNSICNLCTRDL